MDGSGDLLGTLRWGLRKYAIVIVLLAVNVGAMLPILRSQSEQIFEATAIVQGDDLTPLQNQDALPKFGETIFTNGAVEEQVRKQLGLSRATAVIPDKVDLIAEQDNVVFTVVGRDADAETARNIANDAAVVLAAEMSTSGAVGQFSVQSPAEKPQKPVAEVGSGPLSLVIAPLAGALLGVGLVLLLLIWRRPVVDAASAEAVTGSRVLAQVHLPHDEHDTTATDAGGLASLARQLLGGRTSLLLFASPPGTDAARSQLVATLARLLAGRRRVRIVPGGGAELADLDESMPDANQLQAERVRPELVMLDGPTPEERALRPSSAMMILVVTQGISTAALRQAAADYLDGEPMGLILVSRDGRRKWWSGSRKDAQAQAPPAGRDSSIEAMLDRQDAEPSQRETAG